MRWTRRKITLACWLLGVLGASWFGLRASRLADVAVRVIGRTNDPAGRLQIIYEITNSTAQEMTFGLASVETTTGAAWQSEMRKQADEPRELQARRMLGRRSACAVRIIPGHQDVAVRGVIQYEKQDSSITAELRKLARRAGLPHSLWAPRHTMFGEQPFGSIQLPEVATAGPPFLLATTADGVLPEPRIETRHNVFMRAQPSEVIEMYRGISGATVRVDPSVALYGASVTVNPIHDIRDPAELLQVIEDALRQQAGIVVTQRGSNTLTFTWDERAVAKTPR